MPISPVYRVANGPTRGTDWCVLDNPPRDCVAPGGVVLCDEGTRDPHPDAKRAAQSAWAMLARWRDQRRDHTIIDIELPPIADGPRLPAPPLAPEWVMPIVNTFTESYLAGNATLDDVDDWVDRWHAAKGRPRGHFENLHQYLGLNWREYSVWVAKPSLLGEVIAGRFT